MNESAVPTPDTSAATHRDAPATLELELRCPDWCLLALDEHGEPAVAESVIDGRLFAAVVMRHTGPTWGAFTGDAEVNHSTGEVYASVKFDIAKVRLPLSRAEDGESEPLLQLAADARAAGEWLAALPRPS